MCVVCSDLLAYQDMDFVGPVLDPMLLVVGKRSWWFMACGSGLVINYQLLTLCRSFAHHLKFEPTIVFFGWAYILCTLLVCSQGFLVASGVYITDFVPSGASSVLLKSYTP